KPLSADDSAAPLWCESRSSPGAYHQTPSAYAEGVFYALDSLVLGRLGVLSLIPHAFFYGGGLS
ncbi:hypothetical protein, partial [Alkalilimnicola ehrlichii]|uniref:hypothetical protein n=1 Tax=Alkalilimnicola ehrlichii TaxID=351052 RepID=UPI001C6E38B7